MKNSILYPVPVPRSDGASVSRCERVAPAGVEPAARGLGNRRSILLSYGATQQQLSTLVMAESSGLLDRVNAREQSFERGE